MTKFLLTILLCLLPLNAFSAITYYNSASTPEDNGTQATGTIAVTPPASMTTGDLVIVYTSTRNTTGGFSVSEASGQTWAELTNISAGNYSGAIFWCRYTGTWGANPSFTITGTGSGTVVMHVFRPTDTAKLWEVDTTQVELDYTSQTTVTITGFSTTNASTVAFATWGTPVTRTWSNLAGTGWVESGGAQYRNLAGSDTSQTFAHRIQTSAGATNNTSKDPSSSSTGTTAIVAFYEYDAGSRRRQGQMVGG